MHQAFQAKLDLEYWGLKLEASIECLLQHRMLGSALVESVQCYINTVIYFNNGSAFCKEQQSNQKTKTFIF